MDFSEKTVKQEYIFAFLRDCPVPLPMLPPPVSNTWYHTPPRKAIHTNGQ